MLSEDPFPYMNDVFETQWPIEFKVTFNISPTYQEDVRHFVRSAFSIKNLVISSMAFICRGDDPYS